MKHSVLTEIQNGCGLITLNRPEALNALSSEMIDILRKTLHEWALDTHVDIVVIRGNGDKAFCAGGDIKEVYYALQQGQEDVAVRYFKEEYALNLQVATFPKPYIALCHGYTMGGGMGISMYASHRVVTDSTRLAMPENAIGLFPDVGASYFLQKCPGFMGKFMAVTGQTINAAESLYGRLATHYVKEDTLDVLLEGLIKAPKGRFARDVVGDLLDFFATTPDMPLPIKDQASSIERFFSLPTIDECRASLILEKNIYIKAARQRMEKSSPLSLKLSYAFFEGDYKISSIRGALKRDYHLSQQLLKQGNFMEGIRAKLIDKDNNPHWDPSSLDDVSPILIHEMLTQLSQKDTL